PKEVYALKRIHDDPNDTSHSGNALRFDHTVPLALYVARHLNDISFPFRRYSIGPVFRGERAQKGRFRQFEQCDIDVIGSGNLSVLNDAQMPAIIIEIFRNLLPNNDFIVRINNRKILTGLFAFLEIPEDKIKTTLDAVDDLEKLGEDKVREKLKNENISDDQISKLFEFIEITGTNDEIIEQIQKLDYKNEKLQEGIAELAEVVSALHNMKVNEKCFKVDLKIARGLDYYTGTVFETNLIGYEGLGSICSGGRYDDLASVFTGKAFPGVGISIGLTRLLSQLFDAKIIATERVSPTEVLVIVTDEKFMPNALELSAQIRALGKNVETYFEKRKIAKQFNYADKLKIPMVAVLGEDEVSKDSVQLKNMKTGEQNLVKVSELEKYLK
ncbi:MAG: histidine--tRNA ligase, partial [Candidatus Peregrinibacteria bacterium]|nr:histidine--tRNA ligase [Candidatus Peregrinibacteria bacterium]